MTLQVSWVLSGLPPALAATTLAFAALALLWLGHCGALGFRFRVWVLGFGGFGFGFEGSGLRDFVR